MIQPRAQDGSLHGITALHQQNSDFDFENSDRRQEEVRRIDTASPGCDAGMGPVAAAQLRSTVCVMQMQLSGPRGERRCYPRATAGQTTIHIVAHEDVGRRSTIRDDDRTFIGSPFGTADVLVEFAA